MSEGIIQHHIFMEEALKEARQAALENEVPVGAVFVYKNEIIARGHNRMIQRQDPSAHAEIIALREAGQVLSNYRLLGGSLYVTLEPCVMCFGGLVHARIQHLYIGARDPKTGACGSKIQAQSLPVFNHHFSIQWGVLEEECATLLSQFFQAKRRLT